MDFEKYAIVQRAIAIKVLVNGPLMTNTSPLFTYWYSTIVCGLTCTEQ